jgi:HSP20 family protein
VPHWGFSDLTMPHSNIKQTDTAVNVELAVPGFAPDDINVEVDGHLLKIQAQHKGKGIHEEKDSSGKVIGTSKFTSSSEIYESFRLPPGLDLSGMSKNVQDGMLHLTIPKLAIEDRPAQLVWPPKVHTEEGKDGQHILYTITLPGVQKENVRINIENSNLFLTVVEHAPGHNFDSCGTCSTNSQKQQQEQQHGHLDEQRKKEERARRINEQCNKYCERSCVIRLPYGTTADAVDAKFEGHQLIITVQKRSRSGVVSIH